MPDKYTTDLAVTHVALDTVTMPSTPSRLSKSRTLALTCCRSWVGTRRVTLLHVSSPPPLSTVRAACTVPGATPLVALHSTSSEASVAIAMASTEVHPCFIPCRQHARAQRSRTAGAFARYLVRPLPLSCILPEARGLRHGEYAPGGRRDRPPTPLPHPTLRAGFGGSLGAPLPPAHAPSHPSRRLPCSVWKTQTAWVRWRVPGCPFRALRLPSLPPGQARLPWRACALKTRALAPTFAPLQPLRA